MKLLEQAREWLIAPLRENIAQILSNTRICFTELDSMQMLLRKVVPVRRLAFVWGKALALEQDEKLFETQLVCEPQWVEEGETIEFRIQPYRSIKNIKLKICEPFLITAVYIGNQLQASSLGAAREWECQQPANPAMYITVEAKWFTDGR